MNNPDLAINLGVIPIILNKLPYKRWSGSMI
jgi:hypothetical protein